MRQDEVKRYMPYLLSLLVVVLDQATKAWVVSTIPEGTIGYTFFGDFLWLVHVRNTAVAFSLGEALPVWLKYILFVGFPILLMAFIAWTVSTRHLDGEATTLQRWCMAGILGGGIGNLTDRIFRGLRVVDWISFDFFGILGMERFPTWNIGDASVVVSVSVLILTLIVDECGKGRKKEIK
ncbi:MAG: signal peptidase II [Candidatus Ornithospirochaeta sp.]